MRAQIARISQSTTLCPKGQFKLVEDNDREVEDNLPEEGEYQMPSTLEMAKPENWVHASPNILGVGRLQHMDPEVPDDAPEGVDADSLKKLLEDADPYESRLKPIVADSQVVVAETSKSSAWVVKFCGDKSLYINPQNPKQQVNYGVVYVRSLQWPGSYSFFTMGRLLSIYVGHGHKYESQTYFPILPPKIMDDPEEYGEPADPIPPPVEVKEEVGQPEGEGEEEGEGEGY